MKATWIDSMHPGSWVPQYLYSAQRLEDYRSHPSFARLGDIYEVQSGRYVAEYAKPQESDSVPYLRVDNVRPFWLNMNPDDVAYVVPRQHTLPVSAFARVDDVLIARTGTLGKAALATRALEGVVLSQHLTRITTRDRSAAEPAFLCAFLNSSRGRPQLVASGSGSTRLELTHDRLRAVMVPTTSVDRSLEIAAVVRRGVQSLTEAAQACATAVGLYDKFVGRFQPPREPIGRLAWWMPAGELDGLWTPRYYCRFARDWLAALGRVCKLAPLSTLATIRRGKGTRTAQYTTTGVPFVRTSSLVNGGIDPFPDHFASLDTYRGFKQSVQAGDLLLSIEGKIGAVAILSSQERCVFKNHIEHARFFDPDKALEAFLMLRSRLGRAQLRSLTVVQATIPGLAGRSREILIPVGAEDEALRSRAKDLVRAAMSARNRGIRDLRHALRLTDVACG